MHTAIAAVGLALKYTLKPILGVCEDKVAITYTTLVPLDREFSKATLSTLLNTQTVPSYPPKSGTATCQWQKVNITLYRSSQSSA